MHDITGTWDPFQKLTDSPMLAPTPACGPLRAAEIAQLRAWSRSRTSPYRLVVHSRIVLLAGEGLAAPAIAARLSISVTTVRLWCARFRERGLSALEREMPGRGRPSGMSRPT